MSRAQVRFDSTELARASREIQRLLARLQTRLSSKLTVQLLDSSRNLLLQLAKQPSGLLVALQRERRPAGRARQAVVRLEPSRALAGLVAALRALDRDLNVVVQQADGKGLSGQERCK